MPAWVEVPQISIFRSQAAVLLRFGWVVRFLDARMGRRRAGGRLSKGWPGRQNWHQERGGPVACGENVSDRTARGRPPPIQVISQNKTTVRPGLIYVAVKSCLT